MRVAEERVYNKYFIKKKKIVQQCINIYILFIEREIERTYPKHDNRIKYIFCKILPLCDGGNQYRCVHLRDIQNA